MTSTKPPPSTPEAPAPTAAASRDVALVHRVTPDGAVHIIRRRGDTLEAGALQPLAEGAPIHGEVVSLRPRENCPLLCDVDVLYKPPAEAKAGESSSSPSPSSPPSRAARRKGPAQVATAEYRDNWDSIWSNKKSSGALN
ncbi:MAG TPA: hypothetical protein VEQ58_09500 [Polyangiaceae bacterium]|nr:hypothetical protein [Polyangiaceae bacterium]